MTNREITITLDPDTPWTMTAVEKLPSGEMKLLDPRQLQEFHSDLQFAIECRLDLQAAETLKPNTLYYSRLGGRPHYCMLTSINRETGALQGYRTDKFGVPLCGTAPLAIYPASSLKEAKYQPASEYATGAAQVHEGTTEYNALSFRVGAMSHDELHDTATALGVEYDENISKDDLRQRILTAAAARGSIPVLA